MTAARLVRPGVALHTPLLTSAALDAMTGGRVFFMVETLQRTGSFKFRGAYNKLAAIPLEQRAGGVLALRNYAEPATPAPPTPAGQHRPGGPDQAPGRQPDPGPGR